jgi:hypothetical protein
MIIKILFTAFIIYVIRQIYSWYINSQSSTLDFDTPTQLIESSTEFDLEDFKPFLQTIILKNFTESHILKLVSFAHSMKHDSERKFQYHVVYKENETPLEIVLFKNDLSSIAVYFFSNQELANHIDTQIDIFFEERGM